MTKASRVSSSLPVRLLGCALATTACFIAAWSALAQGRTGPVGPGERPDYGSEARNLLAIPATGVIPGAVPPAVDVKNPFEGDPGAIERGMKHFVNFNCVGCHAPNGAGGMGPALSNSKWVHGSKPGNIYLSIYQGRAKGMPAWGTTLPSNVIWELVSYVQSISQDPDPHFGKTISLNPQSPAIEQVPAQELETATPWKHTQPINNGHRP
jgi:cytochrome c oxidase cbb3-type subunit 3